MYLFDLFLLFVSLLVLIVCVLVGVAFLTLLERKVLGYIQIRKGPNKVGFMGILQPFSDAIKLFSKEQTFPLMSNLNIYYFSPMINLFISLLLWMAMPFVTMIMSFDLSILFFLSISSVSVYTVMLAGWSSNSSYSLLGSLRSVAQVVSYEVSLALIFMSFIFLVLSMNLIDFMMVQKFIWLFFLVFPLAFMWVISGLAETNRTPFDFAEGESELVSGFNIEYSSGGFALIFLAEYSSILFMSMICVLLFLGGDLYSFMFFLKLTFVSFLWIWVRGTLPRFRYDKLMYLAWKSFLPCSLNYLLFFFSFKMMIFIFLL
uniref:NADH-ubiquinone oxidoreductase chain 1 n=1 Tax=Epicauta chinensis TaxID=941254 RepID=A0A0U2D5T5_9CUCU|nr:NADH dehydrogenase subunit 1 [Epicauta chinensis]YP_010989339.1 NADH dehydrogenase subunit 1 [Epicauta sibirica]AKL79043.1 NADH dehydrogenase subunit 1 [Epicauta chinensis]WOV67161.1 NADH dehydrogenase subunit 1 [Epicauta sibirica]